MGIKVIQNRQLPVNIFLLSDVSFMDGLSEEAPQSAGEMNRSQKQKEGQTKVMCGCDVTTLRCSTIPWQVLWDFSLTSPLRSPSCCPRPPSSPLCCVCWMLPQSPSCPNCQSSSLQSDLPRSSSHCWEIAWLLKNYYCQRSPRSPSRPTGWSCPDTPGWDPCSGSCLQ